MPKRLSPDGGGVPKRLSPDGGGCSMVSHRQEHLYLVFDDWSCGYSIRKLDMSSLDYEADDSAVSLQQTARPGEGAVYPLPKAFFRLEAPRGLPHYITSAFGTRIMAMHPRVPFTNDRLHLVPESVFPVLDVRSRGIIFAPQLKVLPADPVCLPVGNRLFALSAGSFDMLPPPPLEQPDGHLVIWSWSELPKPPFERQHITSYAARPDEGTILVSTESGAMAATFTFDVEHPWVGWRQVGEWATPFTGEAHFDRGLEAYVGLSKDPDALGYLCACDAPGPGDGPSPAPAWKRGKENLFGEDPAEMHVGATLVYLGGQSKFCLVQCLAIEDDYQELENEEDAASPRRHVVRLTTFSLRYDKNGDLTTGKSRRVRYYKVPCASTEAFLKNPVAFWL